MKTLIKIFGEGKDLNCLQICSRTFVIFFIALILVRISGRRSFGIKTAFDNIIAILLGAVLSRAVVGASPFLPTILASLLIVLLHRGCGWLSVHNRGVDKLINGKKILLYRNGKFIKKDMGKSLTNEEDIMEGVRLSAMVDELSKIEKIYMERNGEISTIKKEYIS